MQSFLYPNKNCHGYPDKILQNDNISIYDNFMGNKSEDISEKLKVTSENIEQQEKQSKILDIESSKLIRNKNKDNPFIAYMNINSLRNKIHDLRYLISDIKPEVLTISETKIDHTFPDAQFIIDGYAYIRKDRNKNGGGLITYIKRGIPHKRLSKLEPTNSEVTCAELTFVRGNGDMSQFTDLLMKIKRLSLLISTNV